MILIRCGLRVALILLSTGNSTIQRKRTDRQPLNQAVSPVLSVIVRKFPQELECEVERLLVKIQQAVASQPGFVGLQSSLSQGVDGCELVTVFAFDSHENLAGWKSSPVREGIVRELDAYSPDSATHEQFGDLALLLHPKAVVSKIEMIGILIFWILILGESLRYIAEFLLPEAFARPWRDVLLITVNVVLISYVFLPGSCKLLTRLKMLISKRMSKK